MLDLKQIYGKNLRGPTGKVFQKILKIKGLRLAMNVFKADISGISNTFDKLMFFFLLPKIVIFASFSPLVSLFSMPYSKAPQIRNCFFST